MVAEGNLEIFTMVAKRVYSPSALESVKNTDMSRETELCYCVTEPIINSKDRKFFLSLQSLSLQVCRACIDIRPIFKQ